jgi:hypothetical protein
VKAASEISSILVLSTDYSGLTTKKTAYPIETYTSPTGAYNFYVPAGTYMVRFHIPDTKEYEGYEFGRSIENDDDNININTASSDGFTKTVTVGEGIQVKDLTLDAAINCGCGDAKAKSNGGDAMGVLSMLMMVLMTMLSGLYFVRREEQREGV